MTQRINTRRLPSWNYNKSQVGVKLMQDPKVDNQTEAVLRDLFNLHG